MIKILNVGKTYQAGTNVLSDIRLDVQDRELLVLLGESGSGKTTLLKMLNRLTDVTTGEIQINGESIHQMDPVALRRRMGYVVQQTGLFPHMTVKENIEIVGKINGGKRADLSAQTENVLRMVGLNPDEYMYRYPRELSGGQAQRVGVARAYATNPEIVLMDEPFSALDPITRNELQNELLRLQREYPKTIVFVTHDIAEAIKLADRIVLLNNGVIEQVGTARELLLEPKTEYVSKFLGERRIWKSPWLLRCQDVMSERVYSISQDAPLSEALTMIEDDSVEAIMVLDSNGAAVGKLTEKILMRHMGDDTVAKAMKQRFVFASEKTPLHDAVKLMNEKDILYLPIVDEAMRMKGMLSMTDLLKIFDSNVLSETAVM